MKHYNTLFITSVAVFGMFCNCPCSAALKSTGFPKTFQDVPFAQRVETKKAGYEPYKNLKAYVVPELKDTDQNFKDELCGRDRAECCRRWPDYSSETTKVKCQPSINYHLFGGKIDNSQKNTCPDIYYTNRGATISCVPTRNHSEFKGWCIDAARKNCAMTQTIPVGDKDDKNFWAWWACVSPAEPKGDQCVCPDLNMDDNCQCTGTEMVPIGNKCQCSDPDKMHIENKNCVCDDPSLDINTQCTTRLTACPDETHQDSENCECLAPGAKPDINGICVCLDKSDTPDPYQDIVIDRMSGAQSCKCTVPDSEIDSTTGQCACKNRSLDIENGCKDDGSSPLPPSPSVTEEFQFVQCRTDLSENDLDALKSKKLVDPIYPLGCNMEGHKNFPRSINKCFAPCFGFEYNMSSNSSAKANIRDARKYVVNNGLGQVNNEMRNWGYKTEFCSGVYYPVNSVSYTDPQSYTASGGELFWIIADTSDNRKTHWYANAQSQVDTLFKKIKQTNFSEYCGTNKHHWYVIAIKNLQEYDNQNHLLWTIYDYVALDEWPHN